MRKFVSIFVVVAAVAPLWSQVQPSASGGGYDLDSEHMMTPPPVSREAYPASVASQEKTNFLSGGLVVTAAATDNLMILGGGQATPDETYAILPTIQLDRKTPRHEETLSYSAGYEAYQKYSQLNGATQDASGSYRLRLTPYADLSIGDSFSQNYNTYNQGNPFTGGGVSGSPGSSGNPLIEPYANELTNSSNAGLEYQYAKNSMIGASGAYSFLQFSENSYLPQLAGENTTTANAFFSRRFGRSYAGVVYQFSKFVTHPYGSYTVSDTPFGFYTHYFTRSFSISLVGGPEYYTFWTQETSKSSDWTPAVQASVGWQVARVNFAANYAHIVSGVGALIGTFHSDTGALSGQVMLSRMWSASANVTYSHYANVNSAPVGFNYLSGGDSISGGIELQRKIAESLSIAAGYEHIHQSFPGITTTNFQEDSNQGNISIMYHFSRPLGR